jgi:hypothetical protein
LADKKKDITEEDLEAVAGAKKKKENVPLNLFHFR